MRTASGLLACRPFLSPWPNSGAHFFGFLAYNTYSIQWVQSLPSPTAGLHLQWRPYFGTHSFEFLAYAYSMVPSPIFNGWLSAPMTMILPFAWRWASPILSFWPIPVLWLHSIKMTIILSIYCLLSYSKFFIKSIPKSTIKKWFQYNKIIIS